MQCISLKQTHEKEGLELLWFFSLEGSQEFRGQNVVPLREIVWESFAGPQGTRTKSWARQPFLRSFEFLSGSCRPPSPFPSREVLAPDPNGVAAALW